MAENKDNLEWWGKPDHLKEGAKPKRQAAPKRQPSQRRERKPKQPLSKRALSMRAVKHICIMITLVLVGAVSAHFVLRAITRHELHCTVPQFEMMTMAEAQAIAQEDDLNLVINDSLYAPAYERGAILDQLPKAGVVVKPGRSVYLTVNATQQRMVDVPYVAERSLRQAMNMLETEGLAVGNLVYKDDLAKNYILAQYVDGKEVKPTSKLRAPIGTEVTLQVGRGGDRTTLVPLLLGQSLRDAKNALFGAGLNIGGVTFDKDVDLSNRTQARVYAQGVRAEGELALGDKVSIRLSASQSKVDSIKRLYFKELERERKAEKAMKDSLKLVMKKLR